MRAGLIYDDRDFVSSNASIRSIGSALDAFGSPFPVEQPARGLYRPITNLSYAIDHAVAGGDAWGHHASSIVLHVLVTLLVYAFARRVLGRALEAGATVAALLTATVFALHPVHCEAVDSVAGRSELLALGFSIAALLAFDVRWLAVEARRRFGAELACAACVALAALSKESGVMSLGLVAAHAFFLAPREARRPRALVRIGLLLAAVGVGYVALRLHALGRLQPSAIVGGAGFTGRLFTAAVVYLENLRLLFFPSVLDVDFYYQHAIGIQTAPSLRGSAGLVALVATLALLGLATRRVVGGARNGTSAVVAFSLSAFLLCLLPTSHVVSFGALMAERFLFGPSFGFALLVGALAGPHLVRRPRSAGAAALTLALVLAARTYARAGEWLDETTLFTPTERRVGPDPRIETNLALGTLARGDKAAAAVHLRRALALDPDHLPALVDLGYVQMSGGALDEAEATFTRVLALDRANASAHNNLGVIAVRRWRYPEAREHYRRALVLNPNYESARQNLASVESAMTGARGFIDARGAAARASDDPAQHLTLARACLALADLPCARSSYARARELTPLGTPLVDPDLERLGR